MSYICLIRRGVIQLFNAVKKQQKMVEEKLKEAGSSVRRRDTALQTMTKGQFLDVLKNTATTVVTEPYQTRTTAVTVSVTYTIYQFILPSFEFRNYIFYHIIVYHLFTLGPVDVGSFNFILQLHELCHLNH